MRVPRIDNSNPTGGIKITVLSELTTENPNEPESGEYARFEDLTKHLVDTPKPKADAKS